MRTIWWACCLTWGSWAAEPGIPIGDFHGANPLAGWAISRDSAFPGADGSLTPGPGHTGQGVVLEYRFGCAAGIRCGGTVAALWTPPKPLPFKHKGAVAMWIRALPEVKLTLLLADPDEGTRRYPFEAASLEQRVGGEWRQVVIPLAAKSTGYWDEDHNGAPKGRMTSLGILAEARYPMAMRGTVSFDDVRVLESPDQTFSLSPGMKTSAPPADSAQLGPRLGVNLHILADDHGLDLAHEAGFSFVRADLLWAQTERFGRYRFGAYDRLLRALEARGMGAMWILDYGHPQHGGGPPRTPDDVAAFARFAEAAATHFQGHNVRYEVWNEPDVERFWQPAPNAREYAALLRGASNAIHRVNPAAPVASGGLARMDLPFLAGAITAAGAVDLTAAGVHPYRRAAPETLADELALFRRVLAGAGRNLEIWDTEWGYASYDYFSKNLKGDGHSAPGRERQAVLACREALTVWALGLAVGVWYDLRDDGADAKNPEHNYGLLDADGNEKAALKAFRELSRVARDHTFTGMVADAPDGAHVMILDGSADRVYVAWSDQPDARITLRFRTDGLISAANLMGEPIKMKNARGEGEIALLETAGPVYLKSRR